MNKPGNNLVPIQPVAEEGNPNRLPFSLEEMLAEFDNGQVPRSTYWKAMIRALYETANHVVTGVTSVADIRPDNLGNIPLQPSDINAPTMERMEGTDERERLSNEDAFGRQLFFSDAFKIKHFIGDKYTLDSGIGYVSGIRVYCNGETILINQFPASVWLDVSMQGDEIGSIYPVVTVVVADNEQPDYTDDAGIRHWLEKISDVTETDIIDLRNVGSAGIHSQTIIRNTIDEARQGSHYGIERIIITERADAVFSLITEATADLYKSYPDFVKFQDANQQWWGINTFNSVNVNAKWFGAKGDGITDDTDALQAAINIMEDEQVLTGQGKYCVTTIYPKAKTVIRDMIFISKPTDQSVAHVPVIRIAGTEEKPFHGLLLDNVFIEGNRVNHQSINLSAGADGGMHGIHIRPYVSDVTIRDCTSMYCGTAGLAIDWDMRPVPAPDPPLYTIHDIKIVRCTFNWNREHGSYAAYCKNVQYIDCIMINNGLDLADGYPTSHGGHGAYTPSNGHFGRGIDIETYGPFSGINNIQITGGDYSDNANGSIQFYIGGVPSTNAKTAQNCVVSNVLATPAVKGKPENYTINISADNASEEFGFGFTNFKMTELTIIGRCFVRGADGLIISGMQTGYDITKTNIGIHDCKRISSDIQTEGIYFISDIQQPVLTILEGSGEYSETPLAYYTQPRSGISDVTYRFNVLKVGVTGTRHRIKLSFSGTLPNHYLRIPSVNTVDQAGDYVDAKARIEYNLSVSDVYVDFSSSGDNLWLFVTIPVKVGVSEF